MTSGDPAGRIVLLVVTGGIAAYKACEVVRELRRRGFGVQVVMTRAATRFVTPLTFEALSGRAVAFRTWPGVHGGSIDHIRVGRELHGVMVAPATADFLARCASGEAGDLATATLLALPASVPVLFAPAMNPEMWKHPATKRNVDWLRACPERHHRVLEPVVKEVACGEFGPGGLPEPVALVEEFLAWTESLSAQ